jgi:mono/diheme cytochrome c family protein
LPEVPEHLLQRSRDRRAALGLGGGDDAAPADSGETAVEPAAEAAAPAAAATAATAPIEIEKPPPPPPPPYVEAFNARRRIPYWAMPVVFLLPIWVVFYAGTLSEANTGELTQLEEGGEVFGQFCASCHGGGGGGGVGPALAGGAVLETFPTIEDHLAWVFGGSESAEGGIYGATAKSSKGGMPAFGESLTAEQLLAVVRYEREVLSGQEIPEDQIGTDEELIYPDGQPWLSADGTQLLNSAGENLFDANGDLASGAQAAAEADAQP